MPRLRKIFPAVSLLLLLALLTPSSGKAQISPAITILLPGEGSVVTSPLSISADVLPGGDGLIRMTLTDRNGSIIARKLLRIAGDPDHPIEFSTSLPFEIPGGPTEALLTLATQDEDHRPLSLRTVTLTLSQDGEALIQPNLVGESWLDITAPGPQDLISGGNLTVQGSVTPITNNLVRFELITDSGGVVGTTQLSIPEEHREGQPFEFEVTLSYAFITTSRDARLVVRQTSTQFRANLILDSLPLILTP